MSYLMYFIRFIMVLVIFLGTVNLKAQFTEIKKDKNIKSEGRFYTKNKVLYSDKIVVKFKSSILSLNENNIKATRLEIDPSHKNVNKLLADLAQKYGEMEIIKKIPSADPNDLQRTNKRTGEQITIHDISQLYSIRFPNPVPVDSTVNFFKGLSEVEFAHQPVSILRFTK